MIGNEVYLWVFEDSRGMANCFGVIAEHRTVAFKIMDKLHGFPEETPVKLLCCLKLDTEWVKTERINGELLNDIVFSVEE